MDRSISVTDARAVLSDLVGRVLDGEEITLTRHGQPVAVLIRPDALRTRRAAAVFAVAEKLGTELEAARHRSPAAKGMGRGEADRRVRELRAERDIS